MHSPFILLTLNKQYYVFNTVAAEFESNGTYDRPTALNQLAALLDDDAAWLRVLEQQIAAVSFRVLKKKQTSRQWGKRTKTAPDA